MADEAAAAAAAARARTQVCGCVIAIDFACGVLSGLYLYPSSLK